MANGNPEGVRAFEDEFRTRSMPVHRVGIVAICVFINMLDGFDILSMSFNAPFVAREWGLSEE